MLRADDIKVWKAFHSETYVGIFNIFDLARDGKTHGHFLKFVVTKCRTDVKIWLGVRIVKIWNSLLAYRFHSTIPIENFKVVL